MNRRCGMNDETLAWKQESRKKVFHSSVFSVYESYCKSPHDELKTFTVLDAADWAIVVPVLETKKFIMVRQWRHGIRPKPRGESWKKKPAIVQAQ